ncbi:MAG: peptide-methionine (R)-S-oxide reductase MsrB [Gammaproteobacteria bacterium]|nr:peptide-methionine (R)-S-oxide reductase MsrB [Gammaproteobacteria bacterium]
MNYLILLMIFVLNHAYAERNFENWVKPSDSELKAMLTHEQFTVTQNEGTEYPFRNAYWDNEKQGIYVDIVSGEALFSSTDQFSSGTGWPSFTQPLVKKHVIEKVDWSTGYEIKEVRSLNADSHLGHVFDDGPDANSLRYCINSAAVRFIAKEDLKAQGYEKYLKFFK